MKDTEINKDWVVSIAHECVRVKSALEREGGGGEGREREYICDLSEDPLVFHSGSRSARLQRPLTHAQNTTRDDKGNCYQEWKEVGCASTMRSLVMFNRSRNVPFSANRATISCSVEEPCRGGEPLSLSLSLSLSHDSRQQTLE